MTTSHCFFWFISYFRVKRDRVYRFTNPHFLNLICLLKIDFLHSFRKPSKVSLAKELRRTWVIAWGALYVEYVVSVENWSSNSNKIVEAVATHSTGEVLSGLWGKVHHEQNSHMDSNECSFFVSGFTKASPLCPLYKYPNFPLGFPGKCDWRCFDLFGGAHCVRQAWRMILAEAHSRWGIGSKLTYGFNVTQLICEVRRGSIAGVPNFLVELLSNQSKDGWLCS